jgi:predicted dienelactone hydrolase
MNRIVYPVVALLLVAACAGSHPQPAITVMSGPSYASGPGLDPVGAIPTAVLHDAQRNKDLEMAIEYPTRGGAHPILIFSHGYGGSKDGYVALTEFWTSHGYVCIKPSHADAGVLADAYSNGVPTLTPEQMRERRQARRNRNNGPSGPNGPNAGAAAAPMPAPPADPENVWSQQTAAEWSNRARDISFIIDSLDALEAKYPELQGKMDHTKIAVGGHSYGAMTAMELGGMKHFVDGKTISLADPRVTAIVAMSPQGVNPQLGLTPDSWRDVRVPALYMTGTRDRTISEEGPERRHDPFAYSPGGDKYFVSIEGARHMSFSGRVGISEAELRRPTDNSVPPGTYPRDPRYPNDDPRDDPYYQQGQRNRPANSADYNRERNIFSTVKSTTLAFFDGYLKADTKGVEYLKGAGLKERAGSGGSAEVK